MLKEERVENYSGVHLNLQKCVPQMKNAYWVELDFSVGGDAPKSFIALYEYKRDSSVRKNNIRTWPKFIAKVGHKWYPLESVNEYFFNQIGETLGLKMASSQLALAGSQLRFLSKYFLKKDESLEHGAQIFAGYTANKEWVDSVENEGLARKFFTFQFAEESIKTMFPNDSQLILEEFVKMLVYDAITGNNDRHFYNWGVIKHIEGKKKSIFAPIYDSARGLFWNDSEDKLEKWKEQPGQIDSRIKKYAEGSKPKIGWDGLQDLNHFELINKIHWEDSRYKEVCSQLVNERNLELVIKLLKNRFSKFYSPYRVELIEKCLSYRFNKLNEIIKGGVSC